MLVAMRGIALLLLVPLAGCDLVFSLNAPVAGDAGNDDANPGDVPIGCVPQTGHDEDDDGTPDDCDPCPANLDDTDTDGDGVGDACGDPDPMEACSQRVFFDGFGTRDSRLTTTDSIAVIPDDLVQPMTNGDTTAASYPALTYNNTIVRAVIGDIVFQGGLDGRVEVASGTSLSGKALVGGYACALKTNVGALQVRLSTVTNDQESITTPFTGSSSGDLVFEFHNPANGELSCGITGDIFAKAEISGVTPASFGSIAFFAHKASAKLRWIEVIERKPNCP